MFHKQHKLGAEVLYLDKEQTQYSKSFMDMLIQIEDAKYHLEFQLLEDKMAIRMYEYGVKETLKQVKQEFNQCDENLNYGVYELEVIMPEQVVIFLSGINHSSEIRVRLVLPDKQEVTYSLPCVSASEAVEILAEKDLYILLPFQQVQLNDRMNQAKNRREQTKEKLAREFYQYQQNVKNTLEKLMKDDILSREEYRSLLETFHNIENYLLKKDDMVREKVEDMGDEDYIPFSEQLKIQRAEGLAVGIVNMGREFGLSDEEIVNRIMKELEVDEETAREQLKNLWSSSRLASESE